MMRAAYYRKLGPAQEVLEIGALPDPQPGPGEVVVRVHTSGVNPSDVKNRAGIMFTAMPFPLIVPHSDGAGVIDAVGQRVDPARVGERVWLWNAQFRRPMGSAAQYVALPGVQAVRMPANLSFEAAACMGIPALTAYRAVTFGQDVAGKTVLVAGGGGAVGHYAVQLAKLKGARVIATAGNAARAQHAKAAGADQVLDYRSPELVTEVLALTGGAGVDRLVEVEFGVNYPHLPHILRQEGVVYVYGSAGRMVPEIDVQQLMVKGVTLHFRSVYLMPLDERLAAIADMHRLIEAKQLQHAVGEVLPLAAIAQAHRVVEGAAVVGNVVVSL